MNDKKKRRLSFSIKTLMALVTLVAVSLGTWIAYENYKIHKLEELRQKGAIVILRNGTPQWLKSIGIERLSPFYSVPTVELYVSPMGNDIQVGDSETPISVEAAKKLILAQVSAARAYGAKDIQLGVIVSDDIKFLMEWMFFARDNSLGIVAESHQRYSARLKTNRESGANINP